MHVDNKKGSIIGHAEELDGDLGAIACVNCAVAIDHAEKRIMQIITCIWPYIYIGIMP